jgi:transketolase
MELPDGWTDALPELTDKAATRQHSGAVVNAIAPVLPELFGGSADLAASNNTDVKDGGDFSADDRLGRNLRFGIREHAMASMANGMALYRGIIPYVATFLVFTDYCRPAIRLASLMQQRIVYVMTHDSIGLGEDGPTHQPVEHLAALRAIPGLTVVRPADGDGDRQAWRLAIESGARRCWRSPGRDCRRSATSRPTPSSRGLRAARPRRRRGRRAGGDPDRHRLGGAALPRRRRAAGRGRRRVRVVSMPSWERFAAQDAAYRDRCCRRPSGRGSRWRPG